MGKREKKSEPGLISQNAPQLAALPIREFIVFHSAVLSIKNSETPSRATVNNE